MSQTILKQALMLNETAARFQGESYGGIPVSLFWMTSLPGRGPDLHVHPYAEIFIMQHGQATFTVGESSQEVHTGEILIVPPHTPHGYKNTGSEALELISIHPSPQVIQTLLNEL